MKVLDFISRKAIAADLKAKDKKGAVTELVKAIKSCSGCGRVSVAELTNAILEREKLGSTGIGRGVAVPHAKSRGITKVMGAFGRSKKGIPFDSIDGEPVHLVFLILSPLDASDRYHKALQSIMHLVKKNSFLNFLHNAKGVKDLEEVLRDAEEPVKV
jgi:mannitol/fructose-specific phosphotransferase system IIA component (Ntr-type)